MPSQSDARGSDAAEIVSRRQDRARFGHFEHLLPVAHRPFPSLALCHALADMPEHGDHHEEVANPGRSSDFVMERRS